MRGLQIAQFGIFLLILGYAVMLFSFALFAIATLSLMLTDNAFLADLSGKLALWGIPSLMLGFAVVGLGKTLCAGAPEEGARKLIIISLIADIVVIVLKVGRFFSGNFLMMSIIAAIISGISFATFCAFLSRMGDNVGEPRVGQYATLMYAGLGGSGLLLAVAFFNLNLGILLGLALFSVTVILYQYTCFTLFRALPIYIEEVRAGITDPTESGEARKEAERKERLHGPGGGGGGNQTKPPEEPKGTPPDGHLLYRVPKGLEPLHLAVKEGDRHKVELRLSQGDDPRRPIKHKLSPLHLAASVGVMDVADCLIKSGAPIDDVCEMGLTPLFFAVQTGNANIAGFFIDKGANLFHKNEQGYTPLHWACCAPHPNFIGPLRVKMVNFLVSKGADVYAQTNDGKTPRDLALENQLEETISSLDRIMGNAPKPLITINENDGEETAAPSAFPPFLGTQYLCIPKDLPPLHAAVKEGDPEKVEVQIQQGASLNDRIEGGISPLHITSITGVMSVMELVLRYGSPVDQTMDHNLTSMFGAVYLNNYNMVGYLVSRGAKVNHQDEMGRTPLHWAAASPTERLKGQDRVKMVQLLLEKGADKKIKDNNGETAEDLARAAELDDIVVLFADDDDDGGSVKGDDDGYYT